MNDKQFYEKKAALLTVLMNHLLDAEEVIDSIDSLEMTHKSNPDHDTLALSDLVSDAFEAAEALRDAVDALATKIH